MCNRENLLIISGEKMKQVETDLLPVVSKKWAQENEDEKSSC